MIEHSTKCHSTRWVSHYRIADTCVRSQDDFSLRRRFISPRFSNALIFHSVCFRENAHMKLLIRMKIRGDVALIIPYLLVPNTSASRLNDDEELIETKLKEMGNINDLKTERDQESNWSDVVGTVPNYEIHCSHIAANEIEDKISWRTPNAIALYNASISSIHIRKIHSFPFRSKCVRFFFCRRVCYFRFYDLNVLCRNQSICVQSNKKRKHR